MFWPCTPRYNIYFFRFFQMFSDVFRFFQIFSDFFRFFQIFSDFFRFFQIFSDFFGGFRCPKALRRGGPLKKPSAAEKQANTSSVVQVSATLVSAVAFAVSLFALLSEELE